MPSIEKKSLNIFVTGFGCCKQEILAARGPLYDIQRFGVNFVSFPEDADVLVIQGLYNKEGLNRVLEIYRNMNFPKWVFGVGSCVLSENIFSKNSHLLKRFREKIKIDVFVPGCPTRPEAFIYSILKFIQSNKFKTSTKRNNVL